MRPSLFTRYAAQRPSRRIAPRPNVRLSVRAISRRAPTPVADILALKPESEVPDVVINGFVRSVRHMKSQSFVSLSDGTSLAPLQALVPTDRSEGCE